MTTQDAIMRAIVAALETTGARVIRNADVPQTIPDEGLIVLNDGEPGEPEITLSPRRYTFTQQAEIIALASGLKSARATSLDALIAAVGNALPSGAPIPGADWIAPGAPTRIDAGEFGAKGASGATIPLAVVWTTANPLL